MSDTRVCGCLETSKSINQGGSSSSEVPNQIERKYQFSNVGQTREDKFYRVSATEHGKSQLSLRQRSEALSFLKDKRLIHRSNKTMRGWTALALIIAYYGRVSSHHCIYILRGGGVRSHKPAILNWVKVKIQQKQIKRQRRG